MRVLEIILEASGGMYDRMQERRTGKAIVFKKGDETLDLMDVQIFPQDPNVLSYKQLATPEEPNDTQAPKQAKPQQQVQPAKQVAAPVAPPADRQPAPLQPPVQQPPEQGLELNPQEEQLVENAVHAPHTETMLADILHWIRSQGAIIDYATPPKPTDAAAIVVILGNPDPAVNRKVACVHWTKTKKNEVPPIFWKTIRFEEATGWIQGNAGKSATAKAAHLKMDPSDLLQHGQRYNVADVPDVVELGPLATREDLDPALKAGIPELLRDILSNPSPVPVLGLEKYMREIEVVLGETAAPLALVTGNRVSGSWDQVNQQLLEPLGLQWSDFTEVSYGQKGGELEDSELFAGDTKLMVSSKDSNGGAAASLKGFIETLDKNPDQFEKNKKFFLAYADLLDILRIIYDESSYDGILYVARELEFINEAEEDYIRSIYKKKKGSIADAKVFPNLPTVLKAKGIMGSIVVNSKGQQVQSKQGVDMNNPKYQFGYHLFGNLAVMIQKYFAEPSRQTRVTNLFKAVLNKADMVQVYTHTKNGADGAYFSNFKVTWPPTFTGKIVILADHYTAMAPAGKKISFKFIPTK
jgi:hypothetical protein